MLELMRAQSQRQPVILVCEDIQLGRSYLIGTAGSDSAKHFRMAHSDHCRPEFRLPWTADARLDLNPLSPAQVASMIESLDFGNELPTAVVGQIISKTDGAT